MPGTQAFRSTLPSAAPRGWCFPVCECVSSISDKPCSAILPTSQQVGVGAADELLGRVVVAELREADSDRALGGTCRQGGRHTGEALVDAVGIGIWQCTHKLIAAVAHDQVVGAHAFP